MVGAGDFIGRLEQKVRQQLRAVRVGFLLGAGSSYLDGNGYPLAGALWESIKAGIPDEERQEIQAKLDGGADGLEKALDLLDTGKADEGPHRHSVVGAVAEHFKTIDAPLKCHRQFVSILSKRQERHVYVFSLNYDPLVERAAELEEIRLFDGFQGHENAFFDPGAFQHDIAIVQTSGRGGGRRRQIAPWLRLIKLHGSLGWYESTETGIRRTSFDAPIGVGATRLMIPPQRRKASDTVLQPYSTLWTEFRSKLVLGPDPVNRLITLGYGLADEHVNDVIEAALERNNFTLIVISRSLKDRAFARWCGRQNVIVITKNRCGLNGEIGAGHPSFWSFEAIIQELDR